MKRTYIVLKCCTHIWNIERTKTHKDHSKISLSLTPDIKIFVNFILLGFENANRQKPSSDQIQGQPPVSLADSLLSRDLTILTLHVPPLTRGQGQYDFDRL